MLFLFLSALTAVNGQTIDTVHKKIPETWKRFYPGLRLGAGIQRSFYTEVGLSLQKYVYDEREGFIVPTIYAAFEWTPSTKGQKPVYGIKIGGETVRNGASGGIEIKYMWNAGNEDVVFTPKLGFGLGFINLLYGYNLSTRKYPFSKIGKHQFSLVINSNIFLYHIKSKKK